ncbi:hypothetical protein P2G88_15670 [Aliiglaciecola sp. CAU 1673]|uniref:hypothetical protein n=1 Tax=Aliiglaciecola sp. CAU 1673 TaxID=3032595 RepID=UPI0023DB4C90|nr:hypothetical protein [Aliiglaciecola sp. CAU 1673]MDF2179689.1 hypothetical protein [Aliiglaciecola sp. CAU 1673]
MLQKLMSVLALALVAGCTTTPEASKALTQNLPALSFYYVPPGKTLLRQCQDMALAGEQCVGNTLASSVYQKALQDSGKFPWVGQDENTDYLLTLATAGTEKTPWLSAQMVLSWRGIPIQSYILKRQPTYSAWTPEEASARLIERFLDQVNEDGLFSASFLANKLGSEDYEDDFHAPDRVSAFELKDKVIYNDPLQGSMLTYQDPQFGADRIEISVYPIPTSDIKDTPAVLSSEANKLRANLNGFVERHKLPPLLMTENKPLSWHAKDKEYKGYYVDAVIDSTDTDPFYAAYFFFVQEDKIVKFTTTFPASYAMDFVKETLPQMQVPQESVFLSKLRAMPD